ncbi:bifunctional riboflavin kinase/FAD synthetase [soil metagenome]
MAHLLVDWRDKLPSMWLGGALAIGNFDGVHRGHQALVAETVLQAKRLSGPAVVLSFNPPPVHILRPERAQPPLTPLEDRIALLEAAGADLVLILHTTTELLQLSAVEFFEQVIKQQIAARAMVEGENFGFGRNREGDTKLLDNLCQSSGMTMSIVPPVLLGDRPISSSRVRQALLAGDIASATDQLNRPYQIGGVVGTGQQRGRTIGFPTANLTQVHALLPADGVYAVGVRHAGGHWMGAANIGANPTFDEHIRKIEVHLVDFAGELLGEWLTVDFLERCRETRRFASAGELVAQLRKDVEFVRRLQSTYPN